MKKIHKSKIIIAFTLLLCCRNQYRIPDTQETRDFRIAKNLDIFFSLFRELNTFYVDEIDPDKLIKQVLIICLKTLDPYTVYYPESESDEFTFMTTGKYGGIGSLVRNNGDYTIISEVYKDFPAERQE